MPAIALSGGLRARPSRRVAAMSLPSAMLTGTSPSRAHPWRSMRMASGGRSSFMRFRLFRPSRRFRTLVGLAGGGSFAIWLSFTGSTAAEAQSAAATPASRWIKGNLHTHTLNSDGDSTPDEVVRWYREHGYDFLVLTDHNFLTGVDGLNAIQGAAGKFLVVRGEEVTSQAEGKPVHVNGFDMPRLVEPPTASRIVEMVQGM